MSEPRCSRCGEIRDESDFARDSWKASGRKSICKACDRAKAKAYYAQNRERVLARVLAYQDARRGERDPFGANRRSRPRRSFRAR